MKYILCTDEGTYLEHFGTPEDSDFTTDVSKAVVLASNEALRIHEEFWDAGIKMDMVETRGAI